jgi:hypothetical protein
MTTTASNATLLLPWYSAPDTCQHNQVAPPNYRTMHTLQVSMASPLQAQFSRPIMTTIVAMIVLLNLVFGRPRRANEFICPGFNT